MCKRCDPNQKTQKRLEACDSNRLVYYVATRILITSNRRVAVPVQAGTCDPLPPDVLVRIQVRLGSTEHRRPDKLPMAMSVRQWMSDNQ